MAAYSVCVVLWSALGIWLMLCEAVCVIPGFSRVAGVEKGGHRQQTRAGKCVCVWVCVCTQVVAFFCSECRTVDTHKQEANGAAYVSVPVRSTRGVAQVRFTDRWINNPLRRGHRSQIGKLVRSQTAHALFRDERRAAPSSSPPHRRAVCSDRSL